MKIKLTATSLRVAVLPVFVLLSVTAMSGTALACDCVERSEKESFRHADLVFEGEVIRIAEANYRTVYTFAVTKVLKGSIDREVIITGSGSNCDADFRPKVIYRVYARKFEDKLISGQCSGNKELKKKRGHG